MLFLAHNLPVVHPLRLLMIVPDFAVWQTVKRTVVIQSPVVYVPAAQPAGAVVPGGMLSRYAVRWHLVCAVRRPVDGLVPLTVDCASVHQPEL